MKRSRILILSISLGGIVVGAVLLLGWLSSDRFDALVRHRLEQFLLRLNLRSAVSVVDLDLFHRTLKISEFRLFPKERSEPLLEVRQLRLRFKIRDLFRRDILLEDVEVIGARMWIVTDERGRSNFEGIDLSSLRTPGEKPLTVGIGRLTVQEGELAIQAEQYPVDLRARNLSVSVQPIASHWQLEARSGRVEVAGGRNRTWRQITRLELSARMDHHSMVVERVRLFNHGVDLLTTGHIIGWAPPRYDFEVRAQASLPDWRGVVSSRGQENLTLRGRISGTGSSYRIEGDLDVRRAALQGMTLESLTAHLRGSHRAASVSTTADVLVGTLFKLRRVDLTSEVMGLSPLSGVIGQMQANTGAVGFVPVEDVRLRFQATAHEVHLREITARSLNGSVQGQGIVRFSGASNAVLHIRQLSLSEVALLLWRRRLPLTGVIDATVSVTWPGLSLGRVNGRAQLTFSGPEGPHTDALATTGEMRAAFTSSWITLAPSHLVVGTTPVRFGGQVSWTGDLDLQLEGVSNNLAEWERLVEAWGYSVTQLTRGIVPRLTGSGRFDLSLRRTKKELHIRGESDLKDLIVGGEPGTSFQSEFRYDGSALELTRAQARWSTGATADFSLRLVPESETGISLSGRFSGVDVEPWARMFPVALPLAGRVTATVTLADLPSAPRGMVEGTISQGKLRLGEHSVSFPRATARVAMERSHYRLSRVVMDIGGGTVRLAGWIDTSAKEFDLKTDGEGVALRTLLEASGLDVGGINGRLSGSLTGTGTFSRPRLEGQLRLTEIVLRGKSAGHIEAEFRREGDRTSFTLVPTLFGQRWQVEGQVDGSGRTTVLSARSQLEHLALTPYLHLAGASADIKAVVSGIVEATVPMEHLDSAQLRASLSRLELQLGDYLLTNRQPVRFELLSSRVKIETMSLAGENTDVDLAGLIDLAGAFTSPGEEILTDLTLSGRVDLRLLRTFYPSLYTSGRAVIRAAMRGSFARPRLSGIMDISEASLRLLDWPIGLIGGHGRIRFTADQALIEGLRAQVNGGDLALSGGLVLRNFKADRWRLVMKAEGVQVTYPAGFRSVLDGDLVLQGSRQLQVLSGTVSVRRSEYHEDVDLAQIILAKESASLRPMPKGIQTKPPMTLDIRVQGLDTVVVRNNLADVVGSAWLHLGGTLAEPQLTGTAIVSRGTLRFRDRDYQINRGRIEFPESLRGRPRFTIEAESDIRGYRVIVSFLGTLDRFQTALRSEPSLTVDEIVSLITTGDFAPTRAATPAPMTTGVGTAANLLFSELTHRAEEFTGKLFGINRFQLDPYVVGRGSDPTARITVGRQVTRDLSILYSTNLSSAQEQVIIIEYRLSNRFSLVGVRDQDGNFSFDVRVRKRF